MMTQPFDLQIYEPLLVTPEYQRIVERIARTQTRATSISWEDAAQTAHTKVWQATQAGKFGEGGVREFYHWTAKVAKNAIIDHIRKQKQSDCESLDQNIPGTDLSLLDTVADDFDLLDEIEFKDLLLRAIEAIKQLDRREPDRGYLKLWEGLKQGKNQSQLAADLGITQGAISKRWKELSQHVAQMLGLFASENVKQKLPANRKGRTERKRSETRW